ncbi:hypothetical protein [Bradyrhizobium sp. SZCCHNR1015]|nr:hypothetical protein [Bradyrhizobium sp. SZCCHNR1015]
MATRVSSHCMSRDGKTQATFAHAMLRRLHCRADAAVQKRLS